MAVMRGTLIGLPASAKTEIRIAAGTSSRRLPSSSPPRAVIPVTLPPGRARLVGEPGLHEIPPGNHDDRCRARQRTHRQRVDNAGGDDDIGVCRYELGGGGLALLWIRASHTANSLGARDTRPSADLRSSSINVGHGSSSTADNVLLVRERARQRSPRRNAEINR